MAPVREQLISARVQPTEVAYSTGTVPVERVPLRLGGRLHINAGIDYAIFSLSISGDRKPIPVSVFYYLFAHRVPLSTKKKRAHKRKKYVCITGGNDVPFVGRAAGCRVSVGYAVAHMPPWILLCAGASGLAPESTALCAGSHSHPSYVSVSRFSRQDRYHGCLGGSELFVYLKFRAGLRRFPLGTDCSFRGKGVPTADRTVCHAISNVTQKRRQGITVVPAADRMPCHFQRHTRTP